MDIMHSEWKVRIENWIAVLKQELYQPIGEITWTAHKTKEYLTPEQALAGKFEPVRAVRRAPDGSTLRPKIPAVPFRCADSCFRKR